MFRDFCGKNDPYVTDKTALYDARFRSTVICCGVFVATPTPLKWTLTVRHAGCKGSGVARGVLNMNFDDQARTDDKLRCGAGSTGSNHTSPLLGVCSHTRQQVYALRSYSSDRRHKLGVLPWSVGADTTHGFRARVESVSMCGPCTQHRPINQSTNQSTNQPNNEYTGLDASPTSRK